MRSHPLLALRTFVRADLLWGTIFCSNSLSIFIMAELQNMRPQNKSARTKVPRASSGSDRISTKRL